MSHQEEEIRARDSNESLPVAVWIFGGGFIFGSEQIPVLYHPRTFTDRGVIFVSFSYRLGALGMATPLYLPFSMIFKVIPLISVQN
jgi:carboxylesterase type B